ncbi:hypothetical protein AX27061_5619 [Achromobacter xylosoxidans NBRC 15126 = ATCC 27061]|nr:hypothetical protein AX27061_5619 [Achromobacter xylosoxidans NBRC 15126 = ATCC 27061]
MNVAVAGLLGCLLGHPSTARKNVAVAGNPETGRIAPRRLALTVDHPHETMFFRRTKVLIKNKL